VRTVQNLESTAQQETENESDDVTRGANPEIKAYQSGRGRLCKNSHCPPSTLSDDNTLTKRHQMVIQCLSPIVGV
jgi:hypothetical protein